MRLALYSSVPKSTGPNLVALQDEALTALPTVLVCPLKAGVALTALRVEVRLGEETLTACTDLARPIRRTGLRALGWLDEAVSREIIRRFLALLAH